MKGLPQRFDKERVRLEFSELEDDVEFDFNSFGEMLKYKRPSMVFKTITMCGERKNADD